MQHIKGVLRTIINELVKGVLYKIPKFYRLYTPIHKSAISCENILQNILTEANVTITKQIKEIIEHINSKLEVKLLTNNRKS